MRRVHAKRNIVLVAVILALFCGVAYARRIAWKTTEVPPVSLGTTLALAEENLSSEPTRYFCIGASLAKTFSDADWALHFSSKEGKELWVNVDEKKNIKKNTEPFEY